MKKMQTNAHEENSDSSEAEAPNLPGEAVSAALAANQEALLRFLARRLGTREDAEDALQEVWLKLVRGKAALDPKANVQAWLWHVLRNAVADQYRRRAARRRFEDALGREPVPTQADPELDAVVCDCLYGLLPTLKPEYTELLRRVDLSREPREEVARQLGLTPNNLAVRLHRARQALRKRLEQNCETCPTHGFRNCACSKARGRSPRRKECKAGVSAAS